MADKSVGGPRAVDPFGVNAAWNCQSATPSTTKQRATSLDENGDEDASATFDTKTEVNAEYELPTIGSVADKLPTLGGVLGGYVITSIILKYFNTKFPTLSLTGHAHSQNTHSTSMATFAMPVTVPASTGKGVPNALSASADIGRKSLTYSFVCEHKDEVDGDGEHLAGQNANAVCTIDAEFVGTASISIPSGFDNTTAGTGNSNSDFNQSSYTLVKGVKRAA